MESSVVVDENVLNGQQQELRNQRQDGFQKQHLACLYTKHKTQKRKVWHDGRLVLRGCCAVLYDANPAPGSGDPVLDQCEVNHAQKSALLQQMETRLETEKFLIEVEGEWLKPTYGNICSTKIAPTMSSSMQKLMNGKFQKPQACIPNRTNHQTRLHAILGKRKRPLQPGELMRMHHRGGSTQQPQASMEETTQRGHYRQQQPGHLHNNSFRQETITRPSGNHSSGFQNTNTPSGFQPEAATLQISEKGRGNSESLQHSVTFDGNRRLEPTRFNHEKQDGNNSGPDSFSLQNTTRDQQDTADAGPNEFSLNNFGNGDCTASNAFSEFRNQHEQFPKQTSKKTASDFASNEFNASSFYGLEEEEKEEETASSLRHSAENPAPFLFGEALSRPPERSLQNHQGGSANGGSNSNSPVSESALLALFGAAPEENQTASQEKDEKSPPKNTGRGDKSSNSKQGTPPTNTGMHFLLPSQLSSSDDDSSQET